MMHFTSRLSEDGLAIFLLHGVVEHSEFAVRNYTRKHIELDFFQNFLKSLLKVGTPISMKDVFEHCHQKIPFPPRAFAITFDDGFENNYSIAAPILKDLRVPATFYVSTNLIDKNLMTWIDQIELALEFTAQGEIAFSWNRTKLWLFKNADEKKSILSYLRTTVKRDRTINTDELVDDICEQLKFKKVIQNDSPLDLKMTWDQIKKLDRDSNFIIGGHSHNHVNLAFLNSRELEIELDTSFALLRDKAGVGPKHYSYPEGLEYCYSDKVISELKKRGVVCSPTAIDGTCKPTDDLFHLRRVFVV